MKEDLNSTPKLRRQRTIAVATTVTGFGLWGGRDVAVEFRPAAPNSGVTFVRRDLDPPGRIAAKVENRVEMPRLTALACRGAQVQMVEHIMAALAGLKIDNCEIWVDEREMPGCDGSSLPFVAAIDAAGVVEQEAPRLQLVIRETIRLADGDAWIEARSGKFDGLSVRYRLDYGEHRAIGRQTFDLDVTIDAFRNKLAPSRTFLLKHEAEWLQSQGLAKRTTTADALVFDDEGPIENELRFEDECVRHKMLDLVGDLALSGCDVIGRVIAHRSGHRLNAELARVLLQECEIVQPHRKSA